MKTINVTDEMYGFLMNLSKEMNEQDNRGTASPYFFQVQETEKIPAHEGSGTEVWYSPEHEIELRTRDDIVDWIMENPENFTDLEHEISTNTVDTLMYFELTNIIENDGFKLLYEDEKHVYSNAFFTSKACDEHIRINKNNLKKPVNYLTYACRNRELDMITKFLLSLTQKKQ